MKNSDKPEKENGKDKNKKYKILIDQKPSEVEDQFITGAQIKARAGKSR